MLRQLRSPKIKTVLWIGLGIFVIPSFVVFYGWGSSRGRGDGMGMQSAATIELKDLGKVEIDRQLYEAAKGSVRNNAQQYAYSEMSQTGNTPDNIVIDYVASDQGLVLNEAISNAILADFAAAQGLKQDAAAVIAELKKELPEESRRIEFQQMLASQGRTLGSYVDQMAKGRLDMLGRQTLASRTRVTIYEAWLEYSHRNDKFKANVVRFNTDEYMPKVVDSEEEMAKWFEENAANFRVEDQVEYEYLLMRKNDMRTQVTPSDDEVTSYYATNKEDFRKPKLAKVRQIFLKTQHQDDDPSKTEELKAQLEDLRERAVKGEDFATLADANTQQTSFPPRDTQAEDDPTTAGGYMGFVREAQVKQQFGDAWAAAVFAMPATGGLSQVLETRDGLALVKVEEVREGTIPELSEIVTEVTNKVIEDKLPAEFELFVTDLRAKAEATPMLEALAEATSITLTQTGKVNKGEPYLHTIGMLGDLKEPINDLTKGGGRSDVLVDADRALVIRIKEEYPAHIPTLEDAKDKVQQAWRRNKAAELAKQDADTLKAKATDLATLEAGALELETTATESMEFTRGEVATGLGGMVKDFNEYSRKFVAKQISLDTLGTAEKGEAPQGYVVWYLAEIKQPERADFARELPQLTQEMANKRAGVVIREFARDRRAALDKEAKIAVDKEYR